MLHFVEVAAIPVAQFALLIEKRNSPPLAFIADKVGASDGLSRIENAIEIRIAKPPENPFQL